MKTNLTNSEIELDFNIEDIRWHLYKTKDENRIPSLLTVKQFCEKHPAFTHGGMRSLIFFAKTNGLEKSKALIRLGRKILINEALFFRWVVGEKD